MALTVVMMTKALKKISTRDQTDRFEDEATPSETEQYSSHFGSDFKLKSEFFEKNVCVDKTLSPQHGEDFTQVKIYRESGIDVIDPRSLKEFIATHKGINQVVIEKFSLNEATRVSLLFEPMVGNQELSSLLEDQTQKHLQLVDKEDHSVAHENKAPAEKRFSLDQLERLINQDFFGVTSSTPIEPSKADESRGSKLSFSFPEAEAPQVNDRDDLQQKPSLVLAKSAKSAAFDEDDKAGQLLNLKLKSDRKPSLEKKLNYEKHTLTRKKAKGGNSFYYRAKDHMELYKVGSSFLKDFNSGLKSFSFASCGMALQREKSVLGITSFFNYHEDINICVITKDLAGSFYSSIAEGFSVKPREIFDEDLTYDVHHAGGFDIVELGELKKVERKLRNYDFEQFLDHLLDSYDLILWDLPDLKILDANKELYFPIIRSLDSVSFIVGKNISKASEITSMISYFNRYQIQIKGLLFSEEAPKGGRK